MEIPYSLCMLACRQGPPDPLEAWHSDRSRCCLLVACAWVGGCIIAATSSATTRGDGRASTSVGRGELGEPAAGDPTAQAARARPGRTSDVWPACSSRHGCTRGALFLGPLDHARYPHTPLGPSHETTAPTPHRRRSQACRR
jgi:hypothetical protein